MTIFKNLNVRRLAEIWVVSNTPAYLLKHYRNEESVRNLAKKSKIDELLSKVSYHTENPCRNIDEITELYAALVAITLQNPIGLNIDVNKLNLDTIQWARRILEIGLIGRVSTNVRDIQPVIINKVEIEKDSSYRVKHPSHKKERSLSFGQVSNCKSD